VHAPARGGTSAAGSTPAPHVGPPAWRRTWRTRACTCTRTHTNAGQWHEGGERASVLALLPAASPLAQGPSRAAAHRRHVTRPKSWRSSPSTGCSAGLGGATSLTTVTVRTTSTVFTTGARSTGGGGGG
jgi:hypothetical protein